MYGPCDILWKNYKSGPYIFQILQIWSLCLILYQTDPCLIINPTLIQSTPLPKPNTIQPTQNKKNPPFFFIKTCGQTQPGSNPHHSNSLLHVTCKHCPPSSPSPREPATIITPTPLYLQTNTPVQNYPSLAQVIRPKWLNLFPAKTNSTVKINSTNPKAQDKSGIMPRLIFEAYI